MRLASAIGIVALALTTAACRTAGARPSGDKELASNLAGLGIEGKTYSNDLGQVTSVRLGKVYVIGDDLLIEDIHGHLTLIDGATLNPRWVYDKMSRPFDKKPDWTPSTIIGISGGRLYVINRSNGTSAVEPRRIDIVASGAPVATDSTIYVPTYPTPSGNKTVQAVSLASGFMGWGYRTESYIVGGMAKGGIGGGDEFYFATSDGDLVAFPTYPASEHSGDMGWKTNLHGAITNDLTVEGADLGVVMTDGSLTCVDRVDGHIRWQQFAKSSERAEGSASFSKNMAFYRCGGEFRAFARDTGAPAWSNKEATGFVAERGGRMLLSSPRGVILSVDKKTGAVLSRMSAAGWTFPQRVAPDSTVYAVSQNGVVTAVEFGF